MGCTLVVGGNSSPRLGLRDFHMDDNILSRILVTEMVESLSGFPSLASQMSSKSGLKELILGPNPAQRFLFLYF